MGDSFRATYRRSASGWTATIDDGQGPITTTAPSLEAARRALAAELAAAGGRYRGDVVIDDEVHLEPSLQSAVGGANAARRAAYEALAESQRLTTEAARALITAGLSLRDAAYVLGLSHARVQQMTKETR